MNILLTSSGRRSYIVEYMKQALNGNGLVHATNSQFSIAMQVADKSICSPMIYAADYIDFILSYCMSNEIGGVMSLFDIDQPVLAKAKKHFADKGVQIVVSDHSVTQICNDKYKTFVFLKENDFHVPLSFIELDEVKRSLCDGAINYPLIVKPRWGMGSIGIYQADNESELDVFYARVKNNISGSYLKYESADDPDHCVIVQEKLEGQELGIDILNDLGGKFAGLVPKKRLPCDPGRRTLLKLLNIVLLPESAKNFPLS